MKKHALGLLLCSLTFFIGFKVNWCYQEYPYFQYFGEGSTANEKFDGIGWVNFYMSIYGDLLTVTRLEFPSKENAVGYFNELLGDDVEIIERNKMYSSKDGNLRGERIVARYKSINNSKVESYAIIAHFNNNVVYVLETATLHYLLTFEEKRRRYTLGN